MRKLSLLAAAAMVAGGSAFAMDGGGVSISGTANFGVKFAEANDTPTSNALAFHHEFDITFAASGTTDGGIGFGAEVTIDNREDVDGTVTAVIGAANVERNVALAARDNSTDSDEDTAGNQYSFITEQRVQIDAGGTRTAFTAAQYQALLDGDDNTDVVLPENGSMSTTGDYVVLTAVYTPADGDTAATDTVAASAVTDIVTAEQAAARGLATITYAAAAGEAVDVSKSKVQNHAKVYISMDMHKLTIGSDLDAADKDIVPGIADLGFDGIGVDDVAEKIWGGTAADVIYNGSFGVASVAFSYGDNAGDAEWAAGFKFSVDPVTVSAGFDSDSAMTVGLGFKQGLIGMNAMFSTDSDREEDNSDLKETAMGVDMSYQMDEATKIIIAAAQYKADNASGADTKEDAIGVGFEHDLGGGAHLKAGAGSVDSNTVADLGITMKF